MYTKHSSFGFLVPHIRQDYLYPPQLLLRLILSPKALITSSTVATVPKLKMHVIVCNNNGDLLSPPYCQVVRKYLSNDARLVSSGRDEISQEGHRPPGIGGTKPRSIIIIMFSAVYFVVS